MYSLEGLPRTQRPYSLCCGTRFCNVSSVTSVTSGLFIQRCRCWSGLFCACILVSLLVLKKIRVFGNSQVLKVCGREIVCINARYINEEARLAQWYSARLGAGWSGFRFPVGAGNFSLHHRIQTGTEAHRASYPMSTRGSLGVKRPGREADHSPPSSAEVDNACSCTSTPLYAFMAWCSVKAQGQLYLLPYLQLPENEPSPLTELSRQL
jgi:hypothetical protein